MPIAVPSPAAPAPRERIWRTWSTTASTTATTNDLVWDQWNLTTSTMSATSNDIWIRWVAHGTGSITTAGTSSTIAWSNWVQDADNGGHRRVRVASVGLSAEQRRQLEEDRRRRDEEWAAARAEDERKRNEANERAMDLLRGVLNDEQNEDLASNGYFYVKAKSGRLYRIDKGRAGNVKVVDPVTKVWQEKLCVHQRESVPYGDTMLMQKLLIETAEDLFREYANISDRSGRYVHNAKRGLLKGDELFNVLMFPDAEARSRRAAEEQREEAAA